MNRTRPRLLVALVLMGAGVGWPADALALEVGKNFLPLSWSAAVGLLTFATALGIWGWLIRDRLPKPGVDDSGKPFAQRAIRPLPPLTAVRTVALAISAARAGAFLVGVYAAIAGLAATHLALQVANAHLIIGATTALCALVLMLVGLWLERRCTLPPVGSAEASTA